MKEKLKRYLALTLSVVMLLSCMPLEALAEVSAALSVRAALEVAPDYTVTFMDYVFNSDGTLSYDANGNITNVTTEWKSVTVQSGLSASVPDPQHPGYQFLGWDDSVENVTSDKTVTAKYKPYASYTLTVNYVTSDGHVVAEPFVYVATADEELSIELPNPTVAGYSTQATSVKVTGKLTDNRTETVTYTPNANTPYKVEHYQQNADGNGYKGVSTVDGTGKTGAEVTATKNTYDGFTARSGDVKGVIAADGSTVLKVYYDRNYVTLTFDGNGTDTDKATAPSPYVALYGAEIDWTTLKATRPGYTFMGWAESASAESGAMEPTEFMPTADKTYYAVWEASDTTYLVVYWQQNADDDGYTYAGSEKKTAKSGTTAQVSTKEYEHFDLNDDKTVEPVILGDGSTVYNVFFDREIVDLVFNAGSTDTVWVCDHRWSWQHDNDCYYDVFTAEETKTYKVRYGQNTTVQWNEILKLYPNYAWSEQEDASSPFYSNAPTVYGDLTLNGTKRTGSTYTIKYQSTPVGATTGRVSILTDYTFTLNGQSCALTEEDCIGIPGFSYSSGADLRVYHESGYTWTLFYTRKKYSINYVHNDGIGTTSAALNIEYQAPLASYNKQLDSRTDENGNVYTFGGWYDNDALAGEPFDFATETMPVDGITLYAKWTAPIKTVTIKFDNGNEDQTLTYPLGQSTVKPEDPESDLAGYVFKDWYVADSNGNATGVKFVFGQPLNSDVTVIAVYDKLVNIPYQVVHTFDGEGNDDIVIDSETVHAIGDSVSATAMTSAELIAKGWNAGKVYKADANSKSHSIVDKNEDGTNPNVITFTYTAADPYTYTVKYVDKETGEVLHQSDPKSTNAENVVEEYIIIEGYTLSDAAQKSLNLKTSEDKTITFYYTKNKAEYKVVAYYQNANGSYTQDESKTKVYDASSLGAGAEVTLSSDQLAAFEKEHYELSNSVVLTKKISANGSTIFTLIYDLVEYKYKVEYYVDSIRRQDLDETASARYGATISTYKEKAPTGYKEVRVENCPLVISNNESNNVIKVYYEKDSFNYTVKYYYDGEYDDEKDVTKSAIFGSTIKWGDYPDKVITGYELKETPADLVITENSENNVIHVYYEKADFAYTVQYYYDNVLDSSKTVTGSAEFGSTVGYTDIEANNDEWEFDRTEPASGTIIIDADSDKNVIKVYYKKNVFPYTIHHYLRGTSIKVAEDETGTKIFGEKLKASAVTPTIAPYTSAVADNTYSPSQEITIRSGANEIIVYYNIPVVVTVNEVVKTYDGQLHGKQEATTSVSGLVNDHKIGKITITGEETMAGTYNDRIVASEAEIVDADNVVVPYYNISYVAGDLTINKRSVTVTLNGKTQTTTYSGIEQTLTGYTPVISDSLLYTVDDFVYSGNQTVTGKDASETPYVMTLEQNKCVNNNDNFDVTFIVNNGGLTITPAKLTIETGSATKEYDGTPLTCDDYTFTGIVDSEKSIVKFTVTGEQTIPGRSNNSYVIDWGTANPNNYEIAKEAIGVLKVTDISKKYVVSVETEGADVIYDGEQHHVGLVGETDFTYTDAAGVEQTVKAVPVVAQNGLRYYVTGISAGVTMTDASSTNNVIKGIPVILDSQGNDVTDQFAEVGEIIGILLIRKRPVTLTSASDSKPYDGTPLTNATVVPSEDTFDAEGKQLTYGFVTGEGVNCTVTGTQTEIGNSKNTFTYTAKDGTNLDNYRITPDYGTLAVTGIKVEHHLQNLDGGYDHITDDDEIVGIDGGTVINQAYITVGDTKLTNEYTGFTYFESDPETLTVFETPDSAQVLKLYYKRTQHTVKYLRGTQGTWSEEGDVHSGILYGATTPEYSGPKDTENRPAGNAGYTFEKWEPQVAGTVTADATYVAQWSADDDTKYTVEYYYQNDDGTYPTETEYSREDKGTTDQAVTVTEADKAKTTQTGLEGTYALDESKKDDWSDAALNGDGSTVLKVYFKQQFTVKYHPGEHGTFTEQITGNLDYGVKTPAAPEATGEAGYTFVGWDPEFKDTVTANATYVAKWSANTNTPYVVEHYLLENEDTAKAYAVIVESATQYETGITDTLATYTSKTFEGYTYCGTSEDVFVSRSNSVDTRVDNATILGDGTLVIKLYYTRDYGYLTITKTVLKDDFSEDASFEFTVAQTESKAKDYVTNEYASTAHQVTVTNADPNLTKTSDKIKVPTGTYSVTEADKVGYKLLADTSNVQSVEVTKDQTTNATFTNVADGTVTVTYEKQWIKPDSVSAPDATITLYRVSKSVTTPEAVASFQTSEDKKLTDTVKKYDEQGNPYTYYIDESVVSDYEKSGQYGVDKPIRFTNDTGSAKITNTILEDATLSISGSKTWVDVNDDLRDDIVVTLLYRRVGSSAEPTQMNRTGLTNPVVSGAYSFENLPKYEVEGEKAYVLEYFVKETPVTGYQNPVYLDASGNKIAGDGYANAEFDANGAAVVNLLNVIAEPTSTDKLGKIKVIKTWNDEIDSSRRFDVPVALYSDENQTDNEYKTLVDNKTVLLNNVNAETNSAEIEFTDLKVYDYIDVNDDDIIDDVRVIGYQVKETITETQKVLYSSEVSDTGIVEATADSVVLDGEITITNTRNVGTLEIQKVVNGLSGTETGFDRLKNGEFKVSVTNGNLDFTQKKLAEASNFEANAEGVGVATVTVPVLPAGQSYTLTESGYDVVGYDVTTKANGESSNTIDVTVAKDQTTTVTFTNTYSRQTVAGSAITLSKKWEDLGNVSKLRPESNEFVVTLTGSDGRVFTNNTWMNTDKADWSADGVIGTGDAEDKDKLYTHTEDGVEITYTVSETVPNLYTPSYTEQSFTLVDEDGEALASKDVGLITNRVTENSLKIKKTISDPTGDDANDKYFRFEVSNTDAQGNKNIITDTLYVKAGETGKVNDLVVGQVYTITELGVYSAPNENSSLAITKDDVVTNPLTAWSTTVGGTDGTTGTKLIETGENLVEVVNTRKTSSVASPVTFTKVWDDNNDAYGRRPPEDAFDGMLKLKQNGDVLSKADVIVHQIDVSNDPSWTIKYTNLPTYDLNGVEYEYTLLEEPSATMEAQYTTSPDTKEIGVGGVLTNTIQTIDNDGADAGLSIQKVITGTDDAVAAAAEKDTFGFVITLPSGANYVLNPAEGANLSGKVAVNVALVNGSATISGNVITVTGVENTDIIRVTGALPVGTYSVVESSTEKAEFKYAEPVYKGNKVDASGKVELGLNESTSIVVENDVDDDNSIIVNKTWDDKGALAEGLLDSQKRPKVTFELYYADANGSEAKLIESKPLEDSDVASQKVTFENVPYSKNGYVVVEKYADGTNNYNYYSDWAENKTTVLVTDFDADNEASVSVTNTRNDAVITVIKRSAKDDSSDEADQGEDKKFVYVLTEKADAANSDGAQNSQTSGSIGVADTSGYPFQVELGKTYTLTEYLADGSKTAATVWNVAFDGTADEDGVIEITPTTAAMTIQVDNERKLYDPTPDDLDDVDNNGKIAVKKVWQDANGNPVIDDLKYSATIVLKRNDQEIDSVVMNGAKDEIEDKYTHTFEGLPAASTDGTVYTYTVSEKVVPKSADGKIVYAHNAQTDARVEPINDVPTNVFYNKLTDVEVPYKPEKTTTIPNDTAQPGEKVEFKIVAKNNLATRANITITDVLTGFEYANDNKYSVKVNGAAVTPDPEFDYSGNTITWTLKNVPAMADIEIVFDVTVTKDAIKQDTITNKATVKTNEQHSMETNAATVGTPTFTVEKYQKYASAANDAWTKEPVVVKPGFTYKYKLVVKNTGKAPADNVIVTDALPAGIAYADQTVTGLEHTDGIVTWTIGSLAAGGTAEVVFDVTVDSDENIDEAAIKTISNQAKLVKVNTSVDVDDILSNEVVANMGNIDVVKTVSKTENVVFGEKLTYTITVTNNGNVALTGVEVSDPMFDPAETGTIKAGSDSITVQDNTYTIDNLAVGASVEITFEYKATSQDVVNGKRTNTVNVSADDPTGGTERITDSDKATFTTVAAAGEVSITKEVKGVASGSNYEQRANYKIGDVIYYLVKVKNTGTVTLTDVVVTDTLTSLSGGQATPVVPTDDDSNYTVVGGKATIATLVPEEEVSILYTYTVVENDLGTVGTEGKITNKATASGKPDHDPEKPVNSEEPSVDVHTAARFSIEKIGSKNNGLLNGVKFELKKDGTVVKSVTTVDGKATFLDIEPGTYTLVEVETDATAGYSILTDTITVTVDANATVAFTENSNNVELVNKVLKITNELDDEGTSYTLTKQATGPESGDVEFPFTVTLSHANENIRTYTVSWTITRQNGKTETGSETGSSAEITAALAGLKLKLKNGEYITLTGMPVATTIKAQEVFSGNAGTAWVTKIDGTESREKEVQITGKTRTPSVTFVNDRIKAFGGDPLTVTKYWNDADTTENGSMDTRLLPENTKIQLRRSTSSGTDEIVVESTEIKGDTATWTYTFKDSPDANMTFPKFDLNGNEYTYYVRELNGTTTLEAGEEIVLNDYEFVVAYPSENANPKNVITNTLQPKTAEQPTKVSTGEQFEIGDLITYTVTRQNYLNKDATVKITDTLEEGLKFVAGSGKIKVTYGTETIVAEKAAPHNASESSEQTVVWTPDVTIPPMATVTLTYQAEVLRTAVSLADANAQLGNKVEVVFNGQPDEKDENEDKVEILKPDLKIEKTADKQAVEANDTSNNQITYTLTVTNSGEGKATLIVVKDTMSSLVTYNAGQSVVETTTSASQQGEGTKANADVSVSGNELTWNVGTIEAGEVKTITYKVTVKPDATTAEGIKNTAIIVDDPTKPTEEPKDETDTELARIDIVKTHNKDKSDVKVALDEIITYTLTVKNVGSTPLTDVEVSDDMFAEDKAITNLKVNGEPAQIATNDDGERVVQIGELAVGADAEVVITYDYKVTEEDILSDDSDIDNEANDSIIYNGAEAVGSYEVGKNTGTTEDDAEATVKTVGKNGKLTVTKTVEDLSDDKASSKDLIYMFEVYRKSTPDEAVRFELTADESYTVKNLGVSIEYVVKEVGIKLTADEAAAEVQVKRLDAWDTTYSESDTVKIDADASKNTVEVKNVRKQLPDPDGPEGPKAEGDLTITKKWIDQNELELASSLMPADVQMQLYRDGIAHNDADSNEPATLSGKGTVWTHTYHNLAKYDVETGDEHTYKVEEVGAKDSKVDHQAVDGNEYTYEVLEDQSTYTITNKLTSTTENVPTKESDSAAYSGVQIGSVVTYTISHTSNKAAVGTTTLVDTLPVGLKYTSGAKVLVTAADVEPDVSQVVTTLEPSVDEVFVEVNGEQLKTQKLTWTVENVPTMGHVVIVFDATVTEDAVRKDTLTNSVIANTDDNTYHGSTESEDDVIRVLCPNLEMVKSVPESLVAVKPGDAFEYTLTVVNHGLGKATNVQVTDYLPEQVTVDAETLAEGLAIDQDGNIVWSISEIAGKASESSDPVEASITFTVTVKSKSELDKLEVPYEIMNYVEITAQPPKNPEDTDEPDDDRVVTPIFRLDVEKTAEIIETGEFGGEDGNNKTASLGDTIKFTVTVKNNGGIVAEDIMIEDVMIGKAIDKNIVVSEMAERVMVLMNLEENQMILKTLEPGKKVEFTYLYKVVESDILNPSVDNFVTVTVKDPVDPEKPYTETDQTTTPSDEPKPSFELTKEIINSDGKPYGFEDEIKYRVTFTNTGNVSLTETVIDDVAGAGDELKSFDLETVAPGETVTIEYTYIVKDGDLRPTYKADGVTVEDHYVTNTATVNTKPANDLKITMTDSKSVTHEVEQWYTAIFVDTRTNEVVEFINVPYGGSIELPDAPEHRGYNFLGWRYPILNNITFNQMIYAYYERDTETIFDARIPLAGGYISNVGDCFD